MYLQAYVDKCASLDVSHLMVKTFGDVLMVVLDKRVYVAQDRDR